MSISNDVTTNGKSSTDRERFLFHYTAVGTAEKIVRSGELWATNIYYLNDGSEFAHGIKIMRSHLRELAPT
ncbi:MAG TPA: hypothetical protein VEO54_25760 [Thermoanaerobaculia bacterium]|nr:hypothetical protein [Thermoanaerobaculia bacterium]